MANIYRGPQDWLSDLISGVQSAGSAITDFSGGSIARTLLESFATGLAIQSLTADQLADDSYLDTATGDALDAKGADYLVARKAATNATGTIRISRAAAGAAISFPAAFAQVSSKPTPTLDAIAVITTSDATMATSDLFVDIPAQAVLPGVLGNLAATTLLIPSSPVAGIVSDGGYVVQVAFTNGTDEEDDESYRARIRTEVQGRVNGTAAAYKAAALGVGGVASANVLKAGDARANASIVPAGSVEVYYEGSAGLLTAVQSAVSARSVLNASVTAFTATSERMVVGCTVVALTGIDTVSLALSVSTAVQAYVNTIGVGEKVYYSKAIEAIRAVAGVISVNVPLADLRKFTTGSGSAADVQMSADRYASLVAADVTVAVTLI